MGWLVQGNNSESSGKPPNNINGARSPSAGTQRSKREEWEQEDHHEEPEGKAEKRFKGIASAAKEIKLAL